LAALARPTIPQDGTAETLLQEALAKFSCE
jgi:hypothetical protein